ncbi:hypothetical protein GQ43DRAFT_33028 [Delitschia confertaspora ATCC 74209]|uniref:AA1-like domain-containing protein n=1 Tax=Delitschia confertaspora ATCC 74209 TaxID=1513339 RepID=A0A9P4MVX1_9PLEO|nr:hypothetical protein GQ43DRAFT_33028 [Delitschia confertaspora ATCC 74209]
MQLIHLAVALLPCSSLAFPLNARDSASILEDCTPVSYTLAKYQYIVAVDVKQNRETSSSLNFELSAKFPPGALVADTSVVCSASAVDEGITTIWPKCLGPYTELNGSESKVEDSRFTVEFRGDKKLGDLQVIHTWKCQGRSFHSNTHHVVNPLSCSKSQSGDIETTTCKGGADPEIFRPENVVMECGTPTNC